MCLRAGANPLNNAVFKLESIMKVFISIVLLAAVSLMNTACVSRTVTTEKGFGEDKTEKKILWIWQKEYRQGK